MNRIVTILSCMLLSLTLWAQTKVSGTVVDVNNSVLPGVIVQVRDCSDSKMLRFGKTDAKGTFTIEVSDGNYIEVSMLGFRKQRIDNPARRQPLRIVMHEEAVSLKEVTVKADKVRMNGDTLTYNVGTFADNNDRSIGDVLAKIPGFEVNRQNGQVSYEGKPISKFYIEGADMLGGKYGVATNSLPQADVGTVQVMRHHQPIHVLEDFTFTDDVAVNIRMKEGAKSHWVTSFNGGAGISGNGGLWQLEGFGLRLKSDIQTMITYKTNNTGHNINKETTGLLNFDEPMVSGGYISLYPPATPGLTESRTLFNRSHAVTANAMKRFDESSQLNVQVTYNNNRETASGDRLTEYFLPDGNRIIDNHKDYMAKDNDLYALVKYEKNSRMQYLKNSLSGDFRWCRQWLNETGTDSHSQTARLPEYTLKDNLYIIRKYGSSLVSFYSNNAFVSRPQSLLVDSVSQTVSQRQYSTHTYIMGGTVIGRFSLSLESGINASLHTLKSDAVGLPDTLGFMENDSRFASMRFYVEPKLVYKTRDINIELCPTTEYLYEKYSADKGIGRVYFSPSMGVKWYMTPKLRVSVGGSYSVEPLTATRFYGGLIMQDFQYVNQGYAGYGHERSKSLRGTLVYNDAMKAVHSILTVSRSWNVMPYTATRTFVGDYIILSGAEQESTSDMWQANLMLSKGINLWNGVVNLRAMYMNSNSFMMQNAENIGYNSCMMDIRGGLDFSFWKDLHLRYALTCSHSRMAIEAMANTTATTNWKHAVVLTLPLHPLTVDLKGEYYDNELINGERKNFFLADIKLSCKFRRADIALSLTNLFNDNVYSYVVNSDLMSICSTNRIRGRELLLSLYYKI